MLATEFLVLEAARQYRGWSQGELSKTSRVSTALIALLENGRATPTPAQRIRLSNALNVQPDKLMTPIAIPWADTTSQLPELPDSEAPPKPNPFEDDTVPA